MQSLHNRCKNIGTRTEAMTGGGEEGGVRGGGVGGDKKREVRLFFTGSQQIKLCIIYNDKNAIAVGEQEGVLVRKLSQLTPLSKAKRANPRYFILLCGSAVS